VRIIQSFQTLSSFREIFFKPDFQKT
jgi:hypothetical protein